MPTITAQTPCQSVPTEAMQIGRTHLPRNGEEDYSINSVSTVVNQDIAVPTVLLNLLQTPLQVIE